MAPARSWNNDPRFAGLDLSDSFLLGFVFEDGFALRLLCEFHLTNTHPAWVEFDPTEQMACYMSGSILFRNCEDIRLSKGPAFSRDSSSFDCGTIDTFEIVEDCARVETDSLKFEIFTAEFAVELDKAN